jgi:hypothetical protein
MQRKSTAAICLILAAIPLACSRNGPLDSLFESSGYHVYINGVVLPDADAASFELLDRAG